MFYSYLTAPRLTAPRWYAEGSAVFFETWMSGGLGRAQGGYDEMLFRAMVRDDAHFYDPLGLASRGARVDFQSGANAYLYGTRFFTYLAYVHSPEKVVAWIKRDEGSKRYYSDQFEHVFGLPVEQACRTGSSSSTSSSEKISQKSGNIQSRQCETSSEGRWGRCRGHTTTRRQAPVRRIPLPGVVEYIGALNTRDGGITHLADIKRAMSYRVTSLAYDPSAGILFFTNDNRGVASLRDLMAVDVRTGDERMLIENARTGEIVVDPVDKSLIGVRHENGIAALVRIPKPYDRVYEIHRFPYGVVPYDLDISPDGRLLLASVSEFGGDQFVRVWAMRDVLQGNVRPLSEFGFGQSVPESFVFSPDGRYVYGSSYYTGVSNIFRGEVATGKFEAVSNAETGLFRPMPLADGRLVALNFTGEGFVPVIIDPKPIEDVSAITFLGALVADKYPVIKTWQVDSPSAVDDQKLTTKKGPFLPLQSMSVSNGFPVIQGYKNSAGIGYHLNVDDPLGFAQLGITAAYTPSTSLPSDERGHVDIYGRYKFFKAQLSWNRSDFYDLFGPVKRSRKGYAAKVGYDWNLIFDEPRRLDLFLDFAYYDKIDTLPSAQNIQTNFTRLLTGEARLFYTDVKRSIGAVDDEKGVTWELDYTGNYVNGQTVPQVRGGLDLGWALPINNSSVWLRTAGGFANGDRNNTVANFYFGTLPQQLRRRQVDQALPRVSIVSRFRHRRDRGVELRSRDGRVESASLRVRKCRNPELLPELPAAVGVRSRALGRSGQCDAAQGIWDGRRSARPAIFRSALVRNGAFGGLRRRISEYATPWLRMDDIAEDHVANGCWRAARYAHASRL
jgi:hypothetical protein